MKKYPIFGLFVSLFVLLVCGQSLAVHAEQATDTEVADPSCVTFTGVSEKVAKAKTSRVKNTLFAGLEGKRVRKIYFKTVSIFDKDDPDENNRLYLFLNKLHINTRPSVVRAQLLFREGDLLKIDKIYESERILRKRRYLTNAYIVPAVVCDAQLDITVVTQDSWALEPQVSLSHKSQDTQTGFALADGNILGTGTEFTMGYSESEARNLVSYDLRNPHIFNSQISTHLYYADTSDGRNTIIDVSHPFYSLNTAWATGIYTENLTLDEIIYRADEQINSYKHQSQFDQVFVGLATDINPNYTQRWLLGMSSDEDDFFPNADTLLSIPEYRKEIYPWVEYQFLQNRFGVFKNINQIQRPEDIALGSNLTLRIGYAGTSFDNPDDIVRYIGNYTYIKQIGEQHIVETGVTIDGRNHNRIDNMNSTVVGMHLAYNYFADEKNRWYTAFHYDVGRDLSQYEELTLGDLTGMRGYPTDFQRGNERYLFTLERRYFSDIHLFNLMRMGAVAFFDAGKSWGIDDYGYSPLLTNVGFGLRFSSTKVRIGNVIHVDVATPTSAKAGIDRYLVTVGAYQQF